MQLKKKTERRGQLLKIHIPASCYATAVMKYALPAPLHILQKKKLKGLLKN
jgi:hypothetical protein